MARSPCRQGSQGKDWFPQDPRLANGVKDSVHIRTHLWTDRQTDRTTDSDNRKHYLPVTSLEDGQYFTSDQFKSDTVAYKQSVVQIFLFSLLGKFREGNKTYLLLKFT